MKFNWTKNIKDYRGLLTFPSTTNIAQQVSIPLFIKDAPLPIRQPKVTEVNTITNADPQGYETAYSAMFFGAPDGLQLQMSGFILTPLTKTGITTVWDPTVDGTDSGARLGLQGWSYGDLISAYIEGRLNVTSTGRWLRTDPSSYTDPYGNVYSNPVISVWEISNQRPKRLQQFSMTLFLER